MQKPSTEEIANEVAASEVGAERAAAKAARGRPRAFDRTAALAQATMLFWSKGYEATSMSDLTKAMGIGSPSLYAAFGLKEALYTEALNHYVRTWSHLVWSRFEAASSAREAVASLLMDSAAALTGCSADIPLGCMMTLSSVGHEGHDALGNLVREGRAVTLERIKARLRQATIDGEIASSTDIHAIARFVQTVQNGMSILARDGTTRHELEAVAAAALSAWVVLTGEA